MYTCFAHMYVYAPHICSTHRPEEGIRFPETRVTNGCEPCVGAVY